MNYPDGCPLPMEELLYSFSETSIKRGVKYAAEERVEIQSVDRDGLTAVVRGSQPYYLELDIEDLLQGEVTGFCLCPANQRFGTCKHQFAVLVHIEHLWERAVPRVRRPEEEAKFLARAFRSQVDQLQELRRHRSQSGALRLELHVDARASLERATLVVELRMRGPGAQARSKPLDPKRQNELEPVSRRVMEFVRPQAMLVEEFMPSRFFGHQPDADVHMEGELLAAVVRACREDSRLFLGERALEFVDHPLRLEVRGENDEHGRALLRAWVIDEEGMQIEVGGATDPLGEHVLAFTLGGWVLTTHRLGRLDESSDVALGITLASEGPMVLPDSSLETLVPLVDTQRDSLQLEELPAVVVERPVPRLSIGLPEDGSAHGGALLHAQVEFEYGHSLVRAGEPPQPIVAGERLLGRDVAAEAAALAQLEALELRVVPDAHPTPFIEHSYDLRLRFNQLDDTVQALCDLGWEVRADGLPYVSSSGSSVRVTSGTDWFGLEGGVEFDGTLVPLPELLATAKGSRRTVHLGDGRVGLLPSDWLAQWGWTEMGTRQKDGSLRFPQQQGWLLDALLAERDGVSHDRGFAQFSRKLRQFDGIGTHEPSKGFQGDLRPYQQEGLGWFDYLSKLGFGGCLADDMGLGKTVQVLALLEARRTRRLKRGEVRRPHLVVAPASVVHNWMAEAERFAPKLIRHEHHGADRWERFEGQRAPHLIVTTYALLRRDAERLAEMEFDYAVLDEAQAIKNATSQAAKAARLLRAEHRLALSGTPIENRLEELWSLFEFLNPGMLGAAPAFKKLLKGGGEQESKLPQIARAVRPFVLRRTKQEVLPDLPPKTEQTVCIDLPPAQRKAYDELAGYYRKALAGAEIEDQNSIQILTALLRLRQAACHPGLIDPDRAGADSAKFDELLPRLEELLAEGHKALVFSQFTELLDLLRQRLDAKGLKYELLTGRTRNRAARVQSFQSEEGPGLFLISLKAGGTGLNLTRADFVFLLDPWWNPAAEAQAIDRAHRMGRTRPVHAYRLVARDTIEERVLELQETKRHLAASILEPATGSVADLTSEDLQHLLA